MDLKQLGGELICQKDSFLCAARGVSIGIAFQRKIGVGLFGGEGFIMQRLRGRRLCFVHAGGTLHRARPRGRRDAARRHRLPRRAAAVGQLRHPVRRQDQDGAVRRRRAVLRHADRARPSVAAVAAAQPHGRPHLQGRARAVSRAKEARSWVVSAICSTATSATGGTWPGAQTYANHVYRATAWTSLVHVLSDPRVLRLRRAACCVRDRRAYRAAISLAEFALRLQNRIIR